LSRGRKSPNFNSKFNTPGGGITSGLSSDEGFTTDADKAGIPNRDSVNSRLKVGTCGIQIEFESSSAN
jgi:hypothetical protein